MTCGDRVGPWPELLLEAGTVPGAKPQTSVWRLQSHSWCCHQLLRACTHPGLWLGGAPRGHIHIPRCVGGGWYTHVYVRVVCMCVWCVYVCACSEFAQGQAGGVRTEAGVWPRSTQCAHWGREPSHSRATPSLTTTAVWFTGTLGPKKFPGWSCHPDLPTAGPTALPSGVTAGPSRGRGVWGAETDSASVQGRRWPTPGPASFWQTRGS